MRELRVCVVGSGPAGIYAVGALTRDARVTVDVLDRLPAPYGLVRYGVAPDHVKMKSVDVALRKIMEHPAVRFLGNVEVGRDVSLEELHRCYDAVVLATGAAVDRRLGIPGEDLAGSFSATEFVAWYSGHPDARLDRFTLRARSVAVIGVGNVAVDVARVLAKTADELRTTDVPDHVLHVLRRSHVEDIHIFGRRGPAQAKFTTKELRELGELANVDVFVDPDDLQLDEASNAALEREPVLRRNLEVLRDWSQRSPEGRPRRLHMHFLLRPVAALHGDGHGLGLGRMGRLRLERCRLDGSGNAVGTGQTVEYDGQMILRSVGYRGVPIPGLPFDERSGTVPNVAGRVLRDGVPATGEYVAGWIKRGPTGVIGTNKHDAGETVGSLLEDAPALPPAPLAEPDALPVLLAGRGVRVVSWDGWRSIDESEADLGRTRGCARVKIAQREDLLAAALGARQPLG